VGRDPRHNRWHHGYHRGRHFRHDGTGAQTWVPQRGGALVNPRSGKCLADNGSGGSGTQATIYDCNGAANQQWTLP
jgi:glucosylceramidase